MKGYLTVSRYTECHESEGFYALIKAGPFNTGDEAQRFSMTLEEIIRQELPEGKEIQT